MGSKKRVSKYAKKTEVATISFEIAGYSHKKGMGVGKFIRSVTVTIGGYDWAIRFYPDGAEVTLGRYLWVYLEFMSKKNHKARAAYDLRLVNRATGLRENVFSQSSPRMFSKSRCLSTRYMISKVKNMILVEESSGYIKDDCLTIECVLTVFNEPMVSNTTGRSEIKVPPSDLSDNFGKLLEKEKGSDVTFIVGGEKIAAHKIILATRSSVFKVELYGEMKEKGAKSITIEDMQPDVFRALLHFIYTDSLPGMDDVDDGDYIEMIRLLLVAADRYAMGRMKLLCESILDDFLDAETVATTLALADQHNCNSLKDACIEFMATSKGMDAVVATEGYANLKRNCPSVLVDVLEKASKLHRK